MIFMDEIDKAKLKVLIKMILIQKSPDYLSANELKNIINKYKWGIRTPITNQVISKILSSELNKKEKHFMEYINCKKLGKILVYKYSKQD